MLVKFQREVSTNMPNDAISLDNFVDLKCFRMNVCMCSLPKIGANRITNGSMIENMDADALRPSWAAGVEGPPGGAAR